MTMNESLLHLVLEYDKEYSQNLWPSTLFGLLCLVIGLFGNGYVLFIYKFKMKDKTESRYFIPYLAIVDTCTSFLTCVFFTLLNFHPLYFPWDFLCRGMNYISGVPTFASALLLLAIAVQRYFGIKPSGRHFSLFWRKVTVGVILVMTVCSGIPGIAFAGVGEIDFEYKGVNLTSVNCQTRNDKYPTYQTIYFGFLAVVLIVNIVTIFVLYVCIAAVVCRHHRHTRWSIKKSPVTSENEGTDKTEEIELESIEPLASNTKTKKTMVDRNAEPTKRRSRKNKTASPSTQFNKMFLTIVVAYVLTFVPAGVVMITLLDAGGKDSAVFMLDFPVWQMQMYSILERTWVINNIVNPFIYSYFDVEFRKYLKNILPLFCRHRV